MIFSESLTPARCSDSKLLAVYQAQGQCVRQARASSCQGIPSQLHRRLPILMARLALVARVCSCETIAGRSLVTYGAGTGLLFLCRERLSVHSMHQV